MPPDLDTTAGAVERIPPREDHPDQVAPSKRRVQSALSWPRTNTSSWPLTEDAAAGVLEMIPPRLVHGPQPEPL